jgi:hypothetical protein
MGYQRVEQAALFYEFSLERHNYTGKSKTNDDFKWEAGTITGG